MSQPTSWQPAHANAEVAGRLAAMIPLTPPVVLCSPRIGQLHAIEIADAIRDQIVVYDGAPYGYYVVKEEGQDFLFGFFQGDGISQALEEARDALKHAVQAPPSTGPPRATGIPTCADVHQRSGTTTGLSGGSQAIWPRGPPEHGMLVDPARTSLTWDAKKLARFQKHIKHKDKNSLIPIGPVGLSMPEIFYCVNIPSNQELKKEYHPFDNRHVFKLPVDTGAADLWFYCRGYTCINAVGVAPVEWGADDQDFIQEGPTPVTLTHNTDPEHEVLFDMLHAPDDSDKNEFSIRYRDTGTVYVRHFPNERIQAMLPCWNWATNAPEQSFSLALPCTVAYAANRTILRQRYDGNLGLAMPRVSTLFERYPDATDQWLFQDAIRTGQGRVLAPREFFLRLIHPELLEECARTNARSFICFSAEFPCPLKPVFTPQIPLCLSASDRARLLTHEDLKMEHWAIGLSGMALVKYQLDKLGAKRDVTVIRLASLDQEIQKRHELTRLTNPAHVPHIGLPIVLDSGSVYSKLPEAVVREIGQKWLNNRHLADKPATLKKASPEKKDTQSSAQELPLKLYWDPEDSRVDLHHADIIFYFDGAHRNEKHEFRCPAKPFLSSIWPFEWIHQKHGVKTYETDPVRRECLVKSTSRPSSILNAKYTLGMSFHWAAFVHYSAPKLNVDTQSLEKPYLRFAPQAAETVDPKTGHVQHFMAKDFVMYTDLPPRLHEAT